LLTDRRRRQQQQQLPGLPTPQSPSLCPSSDRQTTAITHLKSNAAI
jgi:hypothetical protein